MPDTRMKDKAWPVNQSGSGGYSLEAAHLAVLMDIRDELQRLNTLLHCGNCQNIPRKLDRIARSVGTIKTTVKRERT